MPQERIQKFLAAAGFGARRKCEQLVADGRVEINGRTVVTLPVLIDPEKDNVRVDGSPVHRQRRVYYILNKPRGVFCTHDDPAGRTRAVDLLAGVRQRVFPVGRLDSETTGLLLFTNDGALAQKLTHPRHGAPKTYRVQIDGAISEDSLKRLRDGIWLSEGKTAPARIEVIRRDKDRTFLEITQREGKNREVQRMLAKMGHKVRRISHVRIGRLSIKGLPLGAYRPLNRHEIDELMRLGEFAPQLDAPRSSPTARRPPFSDSSRTRKVPSVRHAAPRKSCPSDADRRNPKRPRRADRQASPPPAQRPARRILLPDD